MAFTTMKRFDQYIQRVGTFFGNVQLELKKCAWPERSELVESTLVVIVSMVVLAVYVGLCDAVLLALLRWILR